jgi:hypothetical protein
MVFGFDERSIDLTRYYWFIYVFAAVIVVAILLMLAGVGMKSVGLTGTGRAPEEKTYWKSYDPLIPLRILPQDVSPNLGFDRYTIIADMMWVNTRVATASSTYRHIFHRGSGEGADFLQNRPDIRLASSTTDVQPGLTAGDILMRMPQGLPIRMNPGILADPVKNDMLLFIDTEKDNKNLRESVRVPDIPLGQPFSLAIVVFPTMMEVYVNCGLEVTKMLEGRPRSIEGSWYGLIGPQPLNAIVQNLRIFTGPLSPAQLRSYCKTLPDFSGIRGGCDNLQIASQAAGAIAATS